MKHQSRCEGRRGSVQAGVVKALEVGSFPLKVANWNCLSWQVKSHRHLPANTLSSHCSLIRANPLELKILEWFLLNYILDDLQEVMTEGQLVPCRPCCNAHRAELLSGQVAWLVTEWVLLSAVLRGKTSQLCLLLGSSSCLKSFQFLISAFIPMEFLEIFCSLFNINWRKAALFWSFLCTENNKKKKKWQILSSAVRNRIIL